MVVLPSYSSQNSLARIAGKAGRLGTWKLEDAKNQFSRVVRAALRYGPQVVTRHGREEVVVLAIADYRSLAHKEKSLVTFMRESPLAEAFAKGDLELVRGRDLPRDIPL